MGLEQVNKCHQTAEFQKTYGNKDYCTFYFNATLRGEAVQCRYAQENDLVIVSRGSGLSRVEVPYMACGRNR